VVQISPGSGTGAVAASTLATLGIPWRVRANVTGSYTSTFGGIEDLPYPAGCIGNILDKDCTWGTILFDVECFFPSGGIGYLHARTAHSAKFINNEPTTETFARETCTVSTQQLCTQIGASNYGQELPCLYPVVGGGETTNPPPDYDETPAPPPLTWYEPMTGHYECYYTYMGTDYQTERCTYYEDNHNRIPSTTGELTPSRHALSSKASLGVNEASAAVRPPVFVIVSDSVPKEAFAVAQRRTKGPYKDVLLVPSSTIRPAVLVAAMSFFHYSRAQHGETPAANQVFELRGTVFDQSIPVATRDRAARYAARLATAESRNMGRYGHVKMLELRMIAAGTK
jgi:hypothetical protein